MNSFLILLLQLLGSNVMTPVPAPDSGKDTLSKEFQIYLESCPGENSLKLKNLDCYFKAGNKNLTTAKGA